MRTATQLSRKVRRLEYRAPAPGSEPPPAYLSVPVTVARKAFNLYHGRGAATARGYLHSSKVGQWANRTNSSMATTATSSAGSRPTSLPARPTASPFWDGPDLTEAQAPLIAAPYAAALAQLRPEGTLTSIGIWHARRQTYIEVPAGGALGEVRAAQRLQFGL
jgi:hypothetical protein